MIVLDHLVILPMLVIVCSDLFILVYGHLFINYEVDEGFVMQRCTIILYYDLYYHYGSHD